MRRSKLISIMCATGCVAASLSTSPAQAVPITFNFAGTISTINDPLGAFSGVAAGTGFSGSYTFESTTADADASAAIGRYANALTAFSLTIGAHSLTFQPPPQTPNQIVVRDNVGPPDSYNVLADFAGFGGYSDIDLLGLGGQGSSALFSSDALPLTAAFFPLLTQTAFQLDLFQANSNPPPANTQTGRLTGTLSRLEVAQVPEPGTLALLGLGALGLAAAQRKNRAI